MVSFVLFSSCVRPLYSLAEDTDTDTSIRKGQSKYMKEALGETVTISSNPRDNTGQSLFLK